MRSRDPRNLIDRDRRVEQGARGRPKHRQFGILADIRQRIVNGAYGPGQRVPDRHTLAREFGASSVTIQKAFVELERCGFIESRGQRGTFCCVHPPHLIDFGIVFPSIPSGETGVWSRFWTGLINTAHLAQREWANSERPRRFKFFEGLDGHVDGEDYQQLVRLIEQQRLAGLIFATAPSHLTHTPVVTAPGLPRIAIMGAPYIRGMPYIMTDMHSMHIRALEFFREHRRRQLAVLTASSSEYETIAPLAASYGMNVKPFHIQRVDARAPKWGVNAILAMFQEEQKTPPDALLVDDDHLIEGALEGLRKTGLRVPDDVQVVAMATFPWSPAPMAPVTRIGWETRTILDRCVENLESQRRGSAFQIATMLPAFFESELEANRSSN